MELLKRKSTEEPSASTTTETFRPQKQQRENGTVLLDQPVTCLHVVSYPPGYVPSEAAAAAAAAAQADAKAAKEFPFTLDPFQSEAIKCLDNGESVMFSLSWNSFGF